MGEDGSPSIKRFTTERIWVEIDKPERTTMNHDFRMRLSCTIVLTNMFLLLGCLQTSGYGKSVTLNPVEITEWTVPWKQTRPRDPFVDQQNRVWFVGQRGDYLAVLNPDNGKIPTIHVRSWNGSHTISSSMHNGQVWYAGNRAAHIGKLDPATGSIIKYKMPNTGAE